MKRLSYFLLVITATTLFNSFVSCSKEGDDNKEPQIVFTAYLSGEFYFYIAGTGSVKIEWGDSRKNEKYPLSLSESDYYLLTGNNEYRFSHNYSDSSVYMVSITGENITHFSCYKNSGNSIQITNLDVSRATALRLLECPYTQLTDLDVSKNTALRVLNCSGNQLTNLDISNNIAMRVLNCSGNKLTNLDVSNNIELTSLSCSINKLRDLDVSNNIKLNYLFCNDNQLYSLGLVNNIALMSLYCANNQFTNLDFSQNTSINFINCTFNRISTDGLNSLLETLPKNEDLAHLKYINIWGNPGSTECNVDIATEKGWQVPY